MPSSRSHMGSQFSFNWPQHDFSAREKTMSRTIELTHIGVPEPWELHVRSYCRSVEAIFDIASGPVMRDADGPEYTVFLSRAGSLNAAQQRPKPAISPHRISDA
jgi:hypothetical protein